MREKVVNTRISSELYDKISQKAKKYRTTISSLIRNVVEDGIELYEDVSDAVDDGIRNHLSGNNPVGYQEIIITKLHKCTNCGVMIEVGKKAYVEVSENYTPRRNIICNDCFKNTHKI